MLLQRRMEAQGVILSLDMVPPVHLSPDLLIPETGSEGILKTLWSEGEGDICSSDLGRGLKAVQGPGVWVLEVMTWPRARVTRTEHVRPRGPGPRPVLREWGREVGRRLELGAGEPRARAPESVLRMEVSEVITCVTGRGHLLMISVTEGSPHGRGAL